MHPLVEKPAGHSISLLYIDLQRGVIFSLSVLALFMTYALRNHEGHEGVLIETINYVLSCYERALHLLFFLLLVFI